MSLPVILVLDNIRSFYNVGAIFRTADGAGVGKIFLTGITGYPTQSPRAQRQIAKTALAAMDNVEWEYSRTTLKTLKSLKSQGYQIVVLEQTKKSVEYTKTKYIFPIALIVGHEIKGVGDSVLKLADQVVEIPMHGKAKSLNVAVATGIMLYHLSSEKF